MVFILKGWGFPWASNVAHYYVGCQSLCETSAFFEEEMLEDFDHDSEDNCHVCMRKLWKLKKQERKKLKDCGPLKVSIAELIKGEKYVSK